MLWKIESKFHRQGYRKKRRKNLTPRKKEMVIGQDKNSRNRPLLSGKNTQCQYVGYRRNARSTVGAFLCCAQRSKCRKL